MFKATPPEDAHNAPMFALVGATALCISLIPIRNRGKPNTVRLIFNGMVANTTGAAGVLAAIHWLLSARVSLTYELLGIALSSIAFVGLNLAVILISAPHIVSRRSGKRRNGKG